MINNIDDFFKENEVRIGEGKDFKIRPPLYYNSLNEAVHHYFGTVRNNKDSYHFLLEFRLWNRQAVAFNFSNTDSSVFTILGFHRYFELLLKDILRRIDPFLAVKFLENEKQLIKYLNGELDPESVNTVEFREAFERFKTAIEYYNKTSKSNYEVAKTFSFLNDDTLNRIAKWRNRIMHNGATLPNIYLLDYLVSQKILPLVYQTINTDSTVLENYKPHYFETFTGIKIIEEILKIKFDFKDFHDTTKHRDLASKILHLAHLKELGRTTFKLPVLLKFNKSFHEPYYDDPIGRNKRFAEQERTNQYFHAIKKCPSCGYETLIVYRKEYFDILFTKKMEFISWFTCTTCTYSLKNNLGDPYHFGLSPEILFAEK